MFSYLLCLRCDRGEVRGLCTLAVIKGKHSSWAPHVNTRSELDRDYTEYTYVCLLRKYIWINLLSKLTSWHIFISSYVANAREGHLNNNKLWYRISRLICVRLLLLCCHVVKIFHCWVIVKMYFKFGVVAEGADKMDWPLSDICMRGDACACRRLTPEMLHLSHAEY